MQRRGEELRAELEEVGANLTARQREGVKGVKIDMRSNRNSDPVLKSVLPLIPHCAHFAKSSRDFGSDNELSYG